jgi:hypothetical protein
MPYETVASTLLSVGASSCGQVMAIEIVALEAPSSVTGEFAKGVEGAQGLVAESEYRRK